MGFKLSDVAPAPATISSLTPGSKGARVMAFQVSRTDTVGTKKAVLPSGASITNYQVIGNASNAGTSASLTVGTTVAASEHFTADVKTLGNFVRPAIDGVTMFQLEQSPRTLGDVTLYAKYAETGTASTTGGVWTVIVHFVV